MIDHEYINDATLRGLLWIAKAPHTFVPCGSRFFGDARPDSDFDFVVQEGSLDPRHLKQHGFTERWSHSRRASGYNDKNTVTVYQQGQAQIIFVKSLEKRLAAREWVKANGLDRNNTAVWDQFYTSNP